MHFLSLEILLLLWMIPFLVGGYYYAAHKRKQTLARFADTHLLPLLNNAVSLTKRRWKAALVLSAFAFLIIGAARPAWNPIPQNIERQGRDVMFILDVSRSMLAEDLAPSRLERSKIAILDVIERLQGDRVGLIVFAGNAVVKCPLSLDYGFFRMMLEDVTTDSVSRGGTLIGDAIRKALDEGFDDQQKQFKDLILITDGEDHDSFPIEAAATAGERGIRLIAIGIGDEDQGRRIPITNENGKRTFLTYQNQEVWSKLDGDTLRKMVNATPGGRYLNVATGTFDFGDIYMQLVASAEKRALESKTVKLYEDKFHIFLAIAFILLSVELLLNERKKKESS